VYYGTISFILYVSFTEPAIRAIDSAQLPRLNEPSQVDCDTHSGRWKFPPKFNQPDSILPIELIGWVNRPDAISTIGTIESRQLSRMYIRSTVMRIESPSSSRAKVRSVMNTPLFHSGGVGYTRQHGPLVQTQSHSGCAAGRVNLWLRHSVHSIPNVNNNLNFPSAILGRLN
jgi:hypothetical protein